MAELADALDLGSSSERSTGSIPATRTKLDKKDDLMSSFNLLVIRFCFCVIVHKYQKHKWIGEVVDGFI